MNHSKSVSVQVGTRTLKLETGTLAQQAAGAVMATIGETMVFSAVTNTAKPREGIDFFPLQVEYREKFYAAGKFPGGFFKREARPSEREILIMRVTDRPIRPLFPSGYRNDVQINNALVSFDGVNMPDPHSINASSAALHISEIPFMGPIAAVRVGIIDGQIVIEPSPEQMKGSRLELIYAGTRDKMLMMEGEAKEISEAEMIAAMKAGHAEVVKIIDAQHELRNLLGLPPKRIVDEAAPSALFTQALEIGGAALADALLIPGKQDRGAAKEKVLAALKEQLAAAVPDMTPEQFRQVSDELEIHVVRANVLERGKRPDGRRSDELRPLAAQLGVLPRAHGSAIFNRGETQSLCVVTVGSTSDTQDLDHVVGGDTEKKFMLHYNFPPYSVGEVGRLGMTGRREIGHGNLAERSLKPVIPDDYAYTIRIVSEIMGSNGSSSMASATGGTLALMDAGVPIKRPVAGISVGLFSDEARGRSELVLDILGTEDHCGDMDFKVCGTRNGITGFQVDLKINGLTWDQVTQAFEMARVGRHQILDFMHGVIAEPRPDLSPYAPRMEKVMIDPEKIGLIIGPGGKNIKRMTEFFKVKIDIDDDGSVYIFSSTPEGLKGAKAEIQGMTAEAEIGMVYKGRVTGIKEFGAFVEILPGMEGLLHISEIANERVRSVADHIKVGEIIEVKCLDVTESGRISLSRRALLPRND
ncbi:MAG: polyribonucleotide nucleotidyltransferase [Kiritimatiellia bacterium]